MEETISLQEIFKILGKRIWLIIGGLVAGIALAAVVTFFVITPKYSSEASLLVTLPQSDNEQVNANVVNSNILMINTYKEFIKGNVVMDEVKSIMEKEHHYKGTIEDLRKSVSVEQAQNSLMFSIIATTENAYEAEDIVNTTAEVFQEKAKETMNVDKITIASKGDLDFSPVSPNKKIALLIGAFLGLLVGTGFAFLLEFMDKSVKDDAFITDVLGYNLLGVISEMNEKEMKENDVKIRGLIEEHAYQAQTGTPEDALPERRVL